MTTHSTTMHELLSSDDWLSSPSPGSVPGSVAPPLSPSPVTQQQPQQQAPSFNNTAMSNGYSSPMSNGSYDPYSPNGKQGKQNTHTHTHLVQPLAHRWTASLRIRATSVRRRSSDRSFSFGVRSHLKFNDRTHQHQQLRSELSRAMRSELTLTSAVAISVCRLLIVYNSVIRKMPSMAGHDLHDLRRFSIRLYNLNVC